MATIRSGAHIVVLGQLKDLVNTHGFGTVFDCLHDLAVEQFNISKTEGDDDAADAFDKLGYSLARIGERAYEAGI